MRTFKTIELNIHPAGWPFIAAFAGISALLTAISGTLGMLGWILTVWCVYFFRDPDRIVPEPPAAISGTGSFSRFSLYRPRQTKPWCPMSCAKLEKCGSHDCTST